MEEDLSISTGRALPFSPLPQYGLPPRTFVPPNITGERLSDGPLIDQLDYVTQYIEAGLLKLNKTLDDQEAVQKIVFELITKARLTTEVFLELKSPSYSYFMADLSLEKYLPSSFSRIKWKDVSSHFRNLRPALPDDNHFRISGFILHRSRLPIGHFRDIVTGLDKSILRVGNRMSLENEASVHDYISPVPL